MPGGLTANGTPLQQWVSNGNLQQQWNITYLGDSGYEVIKNVATGKVLEVAGASTANGALIDQADFTGAGNQLWKVSNHTGPDGTTYLEILNVQSGKSLDVTNFSVANGALLQQFDYLGGANQQWQFVPVVN